MIFVGILVSINQLKICLNIEIFLNLCANNCVHTLAIFMLFQDFFINSACSTHFWNNNKLINHINKKKYPHTEETERYYLQTNFLVHGGPKVFKNMAFVCDF